MLSEEEKKERVRARSRKWKAENPNYRREYYLANKKKHQELGTTYYEAYTKAKRAESPEKYRLFMLRNRAKKKGLPFNLEIADIEYPEVCPILGIPLQSYVGKGRKNYIFDCPSVDRIVPELGYTKGNIQVVSYRANAMKNDATPEELVLFAKWVQRTYPEMF